VVSVLVAVVKRRAWQGFQLAISTVFLLGLDRRNLGATANAAVSLVATFVPSVLERRYGILLHPWQRLWLSAALLLHSIGMLGPYDRVWWWDHLTHTLSAAVVGSVGYVLARTHTDGDGRPSIPPRHRAGFVVGFTVGLGLAWELVEYLVHATARRLGFEPLLISYGVRDTALNLLFDLVGASLVVLFGPHVLENVVESLGPTPDEPERPDTE